MHRMIPLAVQPGLIKDDTAFKVAHAGYVEINNMRPRDGCMEVIGGWRLLIAKQLQGKCRGIFSFEDYNDRKNIAIATHSHLYIYRDNQIYDITPADYTGGNDSFTGSSGFGTGRFGEGTFGTPRDTLNTAHLVTTWSLAVYNQWLIASPRGGKIYVWKNDVAQRAVVLENSPAQNLAVRVTAQRQVISYGCNEESSGQFNPRCIRHSDIEDATTWNTASSNSAREHILSDYGKIKCAVDFGDDALVFTNKNVYYERYVGTANQLYVWNRLGKNHGIAGPNAVGTIGSKAIWLAPDATFRSLEQGGLPIPAPVPIDQHLENVLVEDQIEKVYCATITSFNEYWWFYPHRDDGDENSRYVAINADKGEWFEGKLARTAWTETGYKTLPVAVSADGYIYEHEYVEETGGYSAAGNPIEASCRTGDFSIENSNRVIQIQGLRPDIKDQVGQVCLRIWSKDYPQSEPRLIHTVYLNKGQEKADFRATGRILQLEWCVNGNHTRARLGRPIFQVATRGKR